MSMEADFEEAPSVETMLWDEARERVERTLSESDMETVGHIAAALNASIKAPGGEGWDG